LALTLCVRLPRVLAEARLVCLVLRAAVRVRHRDERGLLEEVVAVVQVERGPVEEVVAVVAVVRGQLLVVRPVGAVRVGKEGTQVSSVLRVSSLPRAVWLGYTSYQ